MFSRDLVYDIGLHEGHDTRFYLAKGFRVVAVEANPGLSARARTAYAEEIAARRLVLVDKALWTDGDATIPFYVRDDSNGWSSLFPAVAERDGRASRRIEVQTTTLRELISAHGVPYYVKCDIEGGDTLFLEQLAGEPERPPFVSVELSEPAQLDLLRAAGYDRFQIINQSHLKLYRLPPQPREGRYVSIVFDATMSGAFGLELSQTGWAPFDTTKARLNVWTRLPAMPGALSHVLKKWGKLTRRGWLIRDSWLDVHATTQRALSALAAPSRRARTGT
jgi:FkbM family methyltransferase